MHTPIEIPNKSLFKMNEVCGLTGVKPYVLRFWETEFEQISPVASSSGQKLYEHKDIEAIALIKKFLFEDKMTIEKAKMEIGLQNFAHQNVEVENDEDLEVEVLVEDSDIDSDDRNSNHHFKGTLADTDIQKLVLAKAKLSSLISNVDSLKQTHNWH